MGSTRRSFTDEYKRDAVSLILDGGHTIGEVAKKLGICDTSIRKWVSKIQSQGEPAAEKPLTESERTELARLRKENAKLELQLEFAKKVGLLTFSWVDYRPGSGGHNPPRVSIAMAINASGL